jgi:hypothetical protein
MLASGAAEDEFSDMPLEIGPSEHGLQAFSCCQNTGMTTQRGTMKSLKELSLQGSIVAHLDLRFVSNQPVS